MAGCFEVWRHHGATRGERLTARGQGRIRGRELPFGCYGRQRADLTARRYPGSISDLCAHEGSALAAGLGELFFEVEAVVETRAVHAHAVAAAQVVGQGA